MLLVGSDALWCGDAAAGVYQPFVSLFFIPCCSAEDRSKRSERTFYKLILSGVARL